MLIETPNQLNIENIAGNTDSIEAGIDSSSMPFLFELMSKSMYSNPIGSIVREITSNCFDSHAEAGIEDPVIIKKGYDDEGDYISFIDFGVGLSPDRIKKVYMNYFSSTKRATNDQIGGFGLGSKTPLSYTDYFYINTNFNGIAYQYIFSKGEKVPTLDCLSGTKTITERIKYRKPTGEFRTDGTSIDIPVVVDQTYTIPNGIETTERNGTEVRIYIKNSNDKGRFEQELKLQLCYFDNVYFENWNISNSYNIYEGTHFKFRNKDQYSENMHIVFGKVCYPIDWDALEIEPVNIAVGVRFEIGELIITPNREALRYTDEIKDLVKERIKLATEELTQLYTEQNKMFDSFFAWYEMKTSKPYVTFKSPNIQNPSDKLYLYGIDNINKKHQYKYFQGIEGVKNCNDILALFYRIVGSISGGKGTETSSSHGSRNITEFLKKEGYRTFLSNTSYMNAEKNWLHKGGYVVQEVLVDSIINSNLENLFINYSKPDIKKRPTITNPNRPASKYFNLGAGKRLYEALKAIRAEVRDNCKEYRPLTFTELESYKAYKRENDANLQRKLAGKVFIKSVSENNKYDWTVDQIHHYKGLVIYGFQGEDRLLAKAAIMVANVGINRIAKHKKKKDKYSNGYVYVYNEYYNRHSGKQEYTYRFNPNAVKIIQINKQNEKFFKNKPNMTHVSKLYGDNKLFRIMASSVKIEMFFADIGSHREGDTKTFIKVMTEICPEVGKVLSEMLKYYKNTCFKDELSYLNSDRNRIKDEVIDVATKFNLFDPNAEAMFAKVDKWFEDVEIIRYTDITDKSLPWILRLLKEKKKKLNIEYYQKIVNPKAEDAQLEIVFKNEEEVPVTKFQLLTKTA